MQLTSLMWAVFMSYWDDLSIMVDRNAWVKIG